MRAFIIVALAVAVSGEADPYTIGQVLAGQTNGGVITSTTYDNGVKVAGFPYTGVHAVAPVAAYSGVHSIAPVAAYSGVHTGAPVAAYSGVHAPVAAVHHAVAPIAAVPAVHAAYSAYPYASYAYGKREAEAEPYTVGQVLAGQTAGGVITSTTYAGGLKVAGFPYTGVHAVAPVAAYSAVHAGAPLAAVHGAYSAYPYASYPYHAYGKREAEAEAQWGAYPYAGVHAGVYSAAPHAGVYAAAPHAGVYAAAPHAGVYAAAPHAVAATPFGLTHSSNVGVCTNYLGVQVPC